jgi:ABC-2 type transport system ATP-binding protein
MSIQVQGIVKRYNQQVAVNEASFTVNKGEIVGFLGPNGAGKSTTMKILTGYLTPDDGIATVCGFNVQTQALQSKQVIGYLPESNALYHDMYVKEYLAFVAKTYQTNGNITSTVNRVVELVGLTPEFGKKIGQLSKGYKQRVGLAAALVHNPQVLILDEPTSGLDPNQIGEIREVIKHIGKEKTVLLSSHIMQEVEAMCQRVIVINKGTIVADENISSLKQGRNKQSIVVKFAQPIDASLLVHKQYIQQAIPNNNGLQYTIYTQQEDRLKQFLFNLAVEQKNSIAELKTNTVNLEEVFKQLTNN